jgi:acyl dehydratase
VTEESLITPEIKAMIGQEVDFPATEIIDRSSIRRYAQAISDLNPLYLDEQYAKTTEYGGIIAPPTFIFDVSHDIFGDVGEDGRELSRVAIPGLKLARGGNEYQFFQPARPGDVVHRKRTIINIYERPGKAVGKILFVDYDFTLTNQEGKLLGVNRETLMFFK